MTETQQRFLRAIAERVPSDHVVELHLFPAIRQGGVETGVAVVAEDPRRAVAVVSQADGIADASDTAADTEVVARSVEARPNEVVEAESQADGIVVEADGELATVAGNPADEEALSELGVQAVTEEIESVVAEDAVVADIEPDDAPAGAQSLSRLTIHTARYRLTLKGVDRGKWDFDVVAEADAPLEAVDAVVRGVQRRTGEATQPDRLTSDAFREALELPLAQLER
jgi:hypothetical protein